MFSVALWFSHCSYVLCVIIIDEAVLFQRFVIVGAGENSFSKAANQCKRDYAYCGASV